MCVPRHQEHGALYTHMLPAIADGTREAHQNASRVVELRVRVCRVAQLRWRQRYVKSTGTTQPPLCGVLLKPLAAAPLPLPSLTHPCDDAAMQAEKGRHAHSSATVRESPTAPAPPSLLPPGSVRTRLKERRAAPP